MSEAATIMQTRCAECDAPFERPRPIRYGELWVCATCLAPPPIVDRDPDDETRKP